MNKIKSAMFGVALLAVTGVTGCSHQADQSVPVTAEQKAAFGGKPDPTAQAADDARRAAFLKSHPNGAGTPAAPSGQ